MSHKLFGNRCRKGQRRKGRSSSPASHSKAEQTDGKGQKFSQGSGNKEEGSVYKRSKIPRQYTLCKEPSCKFWHHPVCENCKSEKVVFHCDKCRFRHVEAEGKNNKKSEERWCERISCNSKGVYTIRLCISRLLIRQNQLHVSQ